MREDKLWARGSHALDWDGNLGGADEGITYVPLRSGEGRRRRVFAVQRVSEDGWDWMVEEWCCKVRAGRTNDGRWAMLVA